MAQHISHKQIRKSIKQDDFKHWVEMLAAYAKTHGENLLIALVIAGVAAVLIPLYFKHIQDNGRRAAGLFNNALNAFYKPVDSKADPSKGEAFRNLQEKYQKSREAFADVAGTYASSAWAGWARRGEANSLFYAKEYEKAREMFQSEWQRNPRAILASTLLLRVGACQENLSQWENAVSTYRKFLGEYPSDFNLRPARLGLARCLQQTGKTAEAEKILAGEAAATSGYWSEAARQQLAWWKRSAK